MLVGPDVAVPGFYDGRSCTNPAECNSLMGDEALILSG
jgi:hypothetical protein